MQEILDSAVAVAGQQRQLALQAGVVVMAVAVAARPPQQVQVTLAQEVELYRVVLAAAVAALVL